MIQFLLWLVSGVVAITWSLMQMFGLGGAGSAIAPATSPSPSAPSASTPAWPGGHGNSGHGNSSGGTSNSGRTGGVPQAGTPAAQAEGVVLINTTVDYDQGNAAGTGLVVGADGIVVTNHHVVQASTQVSVTVPATGQTYSAEVLGYSTTEDVAVLKLKDVTGLATITAGDEPVSVGDSVTAVGNAGGTGTLTASTGQVAALGQTITASDEFGNNAEQLTGLIQISAVLQPGDSGGALLNAAGDVVGMNVAGSANGRRQMSTTSFAIPFGTVEGVLEQVMTGQASTTVTIGYPAALGVIVSTQQGGGIFVQSTVSGGAADRAGVTAGSRLTSLDGKALDTATDLSDALAKYSPGDVVTLTWSNSSGRTQTVSLTLGQGPLL